MRHEKRTNRERQTENPDYKAHDPRVSDRRPIAQKVYKIKASDRKPRVRKVYETKAPNRRYKAQKVHKPRVSDRGPQLNSKQSKNTK